jgi:predicted metal-dependent hydrolase
MYSDAYIDFLAHFHGSRDYFECHEILEEYWKQTEENDRKKSVWVGLIQISVALYHHRSGNMKGAYRTLCKGIDIIEEKKEAIIKLGLEHEKLLITLRKRLEEMDDGVSYYSINLPIFDQKLLETAIKRCYLLGYKWHEKSDLSNTSLLKKHTLRDRSNVIKAREEQLQLRKKNRPDS